VPEIVGDLAEKLAVSRQTVNAIETEKYEPSLPLALKIARLFSLRVEEIFWPAEAKAPKGRDIVADVITSYNFMHESPAAANRQLSWRSAAEDNS